MPFQLPKLPYAKSALLPLLSEESLAYHFGTHHRAYVEKTNKLLVASPLKGESLETIVRRSSGELFNQAAQAWNHTFFWYSMSPSSQLRRTSFTLAKAINDAFGDKDRLLEKFLERAGEQFGSGWAWLLRDRDGKLKIENTANASTPITAEQVPLFAVDLWEHAYYLDYRSERREYLKGFLHAIDWSFASERFDSDEVFSASELMWRKYAA